MVVMFPPDPTLSFFKTLFMLFCENYVSNQVTFEIDAVKTLGNK